jgi:hypothetical protein
MSLFKETGEADNVYIVAANNFIPEFKKMVEDEGYSPIQIFNVDNKIQSDSKLLSGFPWPITFKPEIIK